MRTLIRNGRVALDGALHDTDVLVEDERILALGRFEATGAERVLDARGCYVLPGFIDFHTHLDDRIGRYYLADSYESGTRIALENGITTVCTFVTQSPGQSLAQAMAIARAKAVGRIHADLVWHLTPVTFEPEHLQALEAFQAAGYRTLKLYTTYKAAGIFASYPLLEALFQRMGAKGVQFMVHCEDDATIAAVDPAGLDLGTAFSHTQLRPEAAETVAIERVLELALKHQASLHVVHVSTLAGAQALIAARPMGDISFETCPQYLFLDESYLAREDGHRWLCSPPLRGDRGPFLELVRQGGADMLATDHCPFCRADKDAWSGTDLRDVPNGMPGIGGLAHLAWRLWAGDPDRAALNLATQLSLNPARRAGLAERKGALRPGLDADIVVLDSRGPERPLRSSHADTAEPYPGFSSPLAFRHVLLRGQALVRDGFLTQGTPLGQPLQPPVETLLPF